MTDIKKTTSRLNRPAAITWSNPMWLYNNGIMPRISAERQFANQKGIANECHGECFYECMSCRLCASKRMDWLSPRIPWLKCVSWPHQRNEVCGVRIWKNSRYSLPYGIRSRLFPRDSVGTELMSTIDNPRWKRMAELRKTPPRSPMNTWTQKIS